MLQVLAWNPRLPRRTTTGLEGLRYAAVHRARLKSGVLFLQGNGPRPEACSPIEEFEALVHRLQPLIAQWDEIDRAVLVLRAQGYTVREIKRELAVSGDRVCAVIQAVRSYINDAGISNLGDLQQTDDPEDR